MDSPDRTAAQVLAFMQGPVGESKDIETETTEPGGEDDGDTSIEDGPLAMMQDADRYGVVKIVWSAEEDQHLLQVRPKYSRPLVQTGSIEPHGMEQHT